MRIITLPHEASEEALITAVVEHFAPLLLGAAASGKRFCKLVSVDAHWFEYDRAAAIARNIHDQLQWRGFKLSRYDDVFVDNHITFWRRRHVVRFCVKMRPVVA